MTALVVDPLFSPANGQFFISTRQRRACRGLLSIAFNRVRHSASNGLNIVDFGPSPSSFALGRWELRLVVVVDVLTARKQYRIPHGGAVVLAAAQSGSGPGAATCPTGTPDRVRTQ